MTKTELNTTINEAAVAAEANLDLDALKSLSDDVIEGSIENLNELVSGHATAIWMREEKDGEEVLTIAYNVGGKGEEVEGVVSQSLDSGLVSKAFNDDETICHQGFFKHKEQSSSVDKELGQITAHQIATPFKLFGQGVGAVTVIQTLAAGIEANSEWGFENSDIENFEAHVRVLERLFELNVIKQLI